MSDFTSSIFFRRLKNYGVGLVLGLMLSYVFFSDRYPTWLPGSVVMEELNLGTITYSEKGTCFMECNHISKETISDLLESGEVNFSESKTHDSPCPTYAIEGDSKEGRSLRILFLKCDTVSQVVGALLIENPIDCDCE